eukprot:932591_1
MRFCVVRCCNRTQSMVQNPKHTHIQTTLHGGLTVDHYMAYIPIYKICLKSTQNDVICIEIPWTVMPLWHFIMQRVWLFILQRVWNGSDTPSQNEDLILDDKSSRANLNTHVLYERTDLNALKFIVIQISHHCHSLSFLPKRDEIRACASFIRIFSFDPTIKSRT